MTKKLKSYNGWRSYPTWHDKTSVANFWIDAKAMENAAQIALETRQKAWYDTVTKDIFRED